MIEGMKQLVELFFTFVKLALFNYGGGFALIPLVEHELRRTGWLSLEEFNKVIAISQITPGAVAINTATYVGYKVAGIIGAVTASLAIPVPSFIIVIFLSSFLSRHKDHPLYKMIFYGIRPVVVGLVINAAIVVSRDPFFHEGTLQVKEWFGQLPSWLSNIGALNMGSVLLFLISLALVFKTKLNPILVLVITGGISLILHQWVIPFFF